MKERILILLIAVLLFISGCAYIQQQKPAPVETVEQTNAQSSIPIVSSTPTKVATPTPELQEVTISGSTSVEPFAVEAADKFEEIYPHIRIKYQGIGSSAGVQNANEGVTQIGTASRELKAVEKEHSMEELFAGYIAVAVIVNKNNPVNNLSTEQLRGIYTGQITNWNEIGGVDAPITVGQREDGSGTRGRFEELLDIGDYWRYEIMPDNFVTNEGSGHITALAALDIYTIVYSDTKYKPYPDKIKWISINGYALTNENVQNGSYPLFSPFYFVYHEENLNDAARDFLDFVVSPQGQAIAQDEGLIPIAVSQ